MTSSNCCMRLRSVVAAMDKRLPKQMTESKDLLESQNSSHSR